MVCEVRDESLRAVVRTARSVLIDGAVHALEVPTRQGTLTVGRRSRPMVLPLIPGEIVLHKPDGLTVCITVGCGSLIVVDGQVRVIVNRAEGPYDPDLALAS